MGLELRNTIQPVRQVAIEPALRLAPSIDQKQTLRFEQQLLQTQQLSAIIAQTSPMRIQLRNPKQLTNYIGATAYALSRKEITLALAEQTATAMALCLYAIPILGLGLEQHESVKDLQIWLRQKPYSLEDPFRLRYMPVHEQQHIIKDSAHILDSVATNEFAGVIPFPPSRFKKPYGFQRRVFEMTAQVGEVLDQWYIQNAHYQYMGLIDACIPLFCDTVPGANQFSRVRLDRMAQNYGVFYQEFPPHLANLLPGISFEKVRKIA